MNRVVAEDTCSGIGEVCPFEYSEMEGGDYMIVRVLLDISKPLSRGRKISMDDGSNGWVSFKYERLPNICYQCGRLTHSNKDCDLWLDSEATLTIQSRQFGAWMRAPLFSPTKKYTIVIPGIYANRKTGGGRQPRVGGGALPTAKLFLVNSNSMMPPKVSPVSTPLSNVIPIVDKDTRATKDIPPSFEGQRKKGVNFSKELNSINCELKMYDFMEGIDTDVTKKAHTILS